MHLNVSSQFKFMYFKKSHINKKYKKLINLQKAA